jgi:bifunctional non-homologous end joining protein LigD
VKNPLCGADIQLAKLAGSMPEGEDWLFEIKYDGYRILAFIECGKVRLITRNSKDYTKKFHSVAGSLIGMAGSRAMVLDGEMQVNFALDKKLRDAKYPFTKLQGKDVNTLIFPNLSSANIAQKLLQEIIVGFQKSPEIFD